MILICDDHTFIHHHHRHHNHCGDLHCDCDLDWIIDGDRYPGGRWSARTPCCFPRVEGRTPTMERWRGGKCSRWWWWTPLSPSLVITITIRWTGKETRQFTLWQAEGKTPCRRDNLCCRKWTGTGGGSSLCQLNRWWSRLSWLKGRSTQVEEDHVLSIYDDDEDYDDDDELFARG